jgi:hypothetical protein
VRVFVVLLFFAAGAGMAQQTGDVQQALDQLSASYADAQRQLSERDAAIKTLTESLAIARTESELFQKLWTEAQLRAQTLGANLTDADANASQRQLVESVRSLYLAEAERQRLIEQLKRLLAALQTGTNVTEEVGRAKALLASEKPVNQPGSKSSLETARVLEFNPKLRLVVLDVGSLQGARVGMPFLVLRADRVIAWARVVEVRQKICGALIEKTEGNVTVKAGDAASVTKS